MWHKEFLAAFWAAEYPPAPLPARQNKSTIVTLQPKHPGCSARTDPFPERAGGGRHRRGHRGRGRGSGASAEHVAVTCSPSSPWEEKHKSQPTRRIPPLPSKPTLRHGTARHGCPRHGTAAPGRAVIKRPFAPCSHVSLRFKPLELVPEGSHLPGSVITLAPRQRAPNPMAERWGSRWGSSPRWQQASLLTP